MASHITRYDSMPIPPVAAHTQWFDAGAVRFGVEYRLLTPEIAAAAPAEAARGGDRADPASFDDRGVSIHVEGCDEAGALEYLRFDCFEEDPHYHYVCWRDRSNEMLHIDAVAEGDPLAWALERLRSRLPEMLARAGAAHIAARLDVRQVEAVLPRVAETAYRVRREPHPAAVLRDAQRW
jgi:hypothetical protein